MGPAEQSGGGSKLSPAISFCILFPDDETDVGDIQELVVVAVAVADDPPPPPPPPAIEKPPWLFI